MSVAGTAVDFSGGVRPLGSRLSRKGGLSAGVWLEEKEGRQASVCKAENMALGLNPGHLMKYRGQRFCILVRRMICWNQCLQFKQHPR